LKIRVMEVLASLAPAGAERVAVALARGLDRTHFETAVVSLFPPRPGGLEPELEACGVPVRHLGKRGGFDPRMWPRLIRACREFRPDIIHTHSYILRYVFPARVLARVGAIVHTVHNLAERDAEPLGRAINRMAFRNGTVAVALSPALARSFESVYGFAPAAVIPNGVDIRAGYRPEARERWRRVHGFSPADVIAVSVARFSPQKNPLALIEAFAGATRDRKAAHLWMAGDGPLLEPCRDLAARLQAAPRVHFPGLCLDVPELLSACDFFALASDWEGSPVSILEAMAARLPVVATSAGGVPELVDHGATGLLVPPGDIAGLTKALTEMAGSPALRSAMSHAAATRAEGFDVRPMIAAYATLFERLTWRTG
jgi:glycosyltransferase involved in cell wall biosynthesis